MTDKEIEATRAAIENEEDIDITEAPEEKTEETQAEPQSSNIEDKSTQEQPSKVTEPPAQTSEPTNDFVSRKDYDEMLYSLKRQLGRQRDKFENKLSDYEKRFGAFQEEFNAIKNPEKPLNPEDFATYGEYAKAVVEQEVERRWADKEKSMRAEYEKYQQQYAKEMEHRQELDKGINKWYPDEASRTAWHETVSKAYAEGLEDLLNAEKNIVEYLHQTPNYPLILEHFATHKDQVEQICMLGSPLMRILAVHDLENKLVAERSASPAPVVTTPAPVAPAPTQTTTPATEQAPINNLAKPIGKPGAVVEAEPDIFSSNNSLREALRGL